MHRLFYPLLLFFIIGCVIAWRLCRHSFSLREVLRSILSVVFIVPFILYGIIGFYIHNFGRPRNFFYLLPIYFLFIFFGLKKIIPSKKIFYAVSLVLAIAMSLGTIKANISSLENAYQEREMIRVASTLDVDVVLIPYSFSFSDKAFNYYSKRFGVFGKAFPFRGCGEGLFSAASDKIHLPDRFALISKEEEQREQSNNTFIFCGKSFEIERTVLHKLRYGFFEFFNLLSKLPEKVTIFYLKNGS